MSTESLSPGMVALLLVVAAVVVGALVVRAAAWRPRPRPAGRHRADDSPSPLETCTDETPEWLADGPHRPARGDEES